MSQQTVVGNRIPSGEGTIIGSRVSSGEGTVIGSRVPSGEGTVIGSRILSGEGTVIGSQGPSEKVVGSNNVRSWSAGLMMRPGDDVDGFVIIDFINSSGEAEIYRAVKNEKDYAVKIYKRDRAIKEGIIKILEGRKSRHIAQMIKVGRTPVKVRDNETIEKVYEISPVYQRVTPGMAYGELLKLIEQVNEGLHELHEIGIFHKDIKPANIMIDEAGDYRIIDFGISSVAESRQTHINDTTTGISLDYASPDMRANYTAGPREDYYSFGISIYEFFAKELPYAELGTDNLRYAQLNSVGVKVRETLHMPMELVKLIHGLTYYNNQDPNRRWGYEKVKEWLKNPNAMEDLDMSKLNPSAGKKKAAENTDATTVFERSYSWQNKQLKDSYSLADELGNAWESGKKQIGRGMLSDFFKLNGPEYNSFRMICEDLEELLNSDNVSEKKINEEFWKLLYQLEPKLTKFYWKYPKEDGKTGYTCQEVGVYFFLHPLMNQERGTRIPAITQELVNNDLLAIFLKEYLKDENRYQKFLKLQKEYKVYSSEKYIWKIGYLMTGKAMFRYHNQEFENRDELYEHILEWTNSLDRKEACEIARRFEKTEEFKAWIEYQEEN